MDIVSVINYKGGVGKTTTTSNLGAELAWRGYSVLMLDLDPQASLTFSFISPEEWSKSFADSSTIKQWFDTFEFSHSISISSLIHAPKRVNDHLNGRGRVDLICSHLGLINVDLELATHLGGSTLRQAKQKFIRVHRALADGLAEIDQSQYDIILVDCPPNFNIVTKTAIVASTSILIPAWPDYLSTLGIDYLVRNVNQLVKEYNEYADLDTGDPVSQISPKVLGVLFTMIREYAEEPIATQRQFIGQIEAHPRIPVFESYIKHNSKLFGDSPQYGVPVVLHGYSNPTHDRVVGGIEEAATEFEQSLGWK